jgi:hypothetical protein
MAEHQTLAITVRKETSFGLSISDQIVTEIHKGK